jgi:hypothetical protein
MNLGRVSKKWAAAARQYHKPPWAVHQENMWASILIGSLWIYATALWQHRNTTLDGAMVEEQAQKIYYIRFQENNSIILSIHHYLFTSRTIYQWLQYTFDALSAWGEAFQIVSFQDGHLRARSQTFFFTTAS